MARKDRSATDPRTHCPVCGKSYEDVEKMPRRRICRGCYRARERISLRARYDREMRQAHRPAEFLAPVAKAFTPEDLAKREARMARYAEQVARGEPIEFEPRFSTSGRGMGAEG